MADKLNPNDDLALIGSVTSQDGRSTLVMQGDGNLVLYRSGGKARWATGTEGQAVSQAIMQGDGNFVMYGPGGAYIWDTATAGHPGAVLVIQDDGNVVIYDSTGTPLWATNTDIISRVVASFLPSTSGFHFSNSTFPSVPDLTINILGQQIAIGDASMGLCGGMVFAARDYFEAGLSIPSDTTNPSSGPFFDYIVRRLFDSFNLLLPPPPLHILTPTPPFGPGPLTYMWLMNPDLPDHETVASNTGLAPRGRAWIMISEEWPKIKADLDSGRLSPIGLVELKSLDASQMGKNHQVLAYGYTLDGAALAIRLYDPNSPDNDTVTMSLSIAEPQHTTSVTNSVVAPVWCFFRPDYTFAHPVHRFLLQTGTALQETDETVTFTLASNNDLFAILKSNTGSNSTEVHVLSAASNYQEFIFQTGTVLQQTDVTFEFALTGNRDLFALMKSNTGTHTTEVHIVDLP